MTVDRPAHFVNFWLRRLKRQRKVVGKIPKITSGPSRMDFNKAGVTLKEEDLIILRVFINHLLLKYFSLYSWLLYPVGSKTTDECGDDWRRVHTTGDEYIRVGIVQETGTYECPEVRRRVHTSAQRSGDEYIRQETSTYQCLEFRRRIHTSA